ncbi:MAG: hypothetical protein M0R29_07270 [Aquamicrobium sp.]|nr:glucoamylase family protein [Aquamicrobium sp.]MCK9550529.1 hypothetical protein [Aquamicrobium sp.]
MDHGGPLFIAHYSFCGLDPCGLTDRHADYRQQNVCHMPVTFALVPILRETAAIGGLRSVKHRTLFSQVLQIDIHRSGN